MKVRELLEMFRLHTRVLKQLLISNLFLDKIKKNATKQNKHVAFRKKSDFCNI